MDYKLTDRDIQRRLEFSLPEREIDWRVMQTGQSKDGKTWCIVVPYLNARTVRKRLTQIFGPSGWTTTMTRGDDDCVCSLTCQFPSGPVTRADAAGDSQIEGEKGSASVSLRRAAANFGVGEYLYYVPTTFAEVSAEKQKGTWRFHRGSKGSPSFYWQIPPMPARMVPDLGKPADRDSIKEAAEAAGVTLEAVGAYMWEQYGVHELTALEAFLIDKLEAWIHAQKQEA